MIFSACAFDGGCYLFSWIYFIGQFFLRYIVWSCYKIWTLLIFILLRCIFFVMLSGIFAKAGNLREEAFISTCSSSLYLFFAWCKSPFQLSWKFVGGYYQKHRLYWWGYKVLLYICCWWFFIMISFLLNFMEFAMENMKLIL